MRRTLRRCRTLHADQAGQTSLEWALLMACVGIPLLMVFRWLLGALVEHYRMISFFETLPFP